MNAQQLVAVPIAGVVALAVAATPAAAQAGDTAVARFRVGDETRTVSRDEVAQFLYTRTRSSDTTKEAVDHLIDVEMVEQAAKAEGVMPSGREVRDELARLETAVRRQGLDFDRVLAERRMTRETMTEQLGIVLAKKRLAAKVLGKKPEEMTPQHLELWSRQQGNRVKIVRDPAALPAGVVARVGEGEVTGLDVGRVLFHKISQANLERMVRRLIFWRLVAAAAQREGITVSRSELELHYAKKKAAFERNPSSKGVPYEQWLQAMGGSKQSELNSDTARAVIQHDKLVRRRYSATALDDMLAKDAAAIMRRHGMRRDLSIIQVRATDKPNRIVRRDFASAEKEAAALRKRITEGNDPFAHVARTSSDDPESKAKGGKIGWQQREYREGSPGQRAPKEVLDAAFSLGIGEVSQPIRAEQGVYLVWVSGIEPEPEKSVVQERLLAELADDYTREMIEAAKIEFVGARAREGDPRGKGGGR